MDSPAFDEGGVFEGPPFPWRVIPSVGLSGETLIDFSELIVSFIAHASQQANSFYQICRALEVVLDPALRSLTSSFVFIRLPSLLSRPLPSPVPFPLHHKKHQMQAGRRYSDVEARGYRR